MSVPAASADAVFWPHAASADVASTRIRCLQVVDALRAAGSDAHVHAAATPPAGAPRVLVLAKRYDAASLAAAEALRAAHGTRLVLDLCDNHFEPAPGDAHWGPRAEQLRRCVAAVDAVVASGSALAGVVRAQVPQQRLVTVIDDAIDPAARHAPRPRALSAEGLHAARLAGFFALHRAAPGRRLVWFGHHGNAIAEAGLADLLRLRAALEAHHARAPLTLTVVSSRWRRFREVLAGWRLPALYVPWHRDGFGWVLRRHAVALLPVTPNGFTRCKTANRAVTALVAGLAVAAEATPAYAEMGDALLLDDFGTGLARLMDDDAARAAAVQRGRALAEARFAPQTIAARWQALLQDLAAAPPAAGLASAGAARLAHRTSA